MSKLEDIDRQREQIHQAMAIEMMEQLSNGQNNSSSINRMDILNIIEKIKEKQENYILCHKNLKDANEEIISNFTEQQRIKYEPIFQTVKKIVILIFLYLKLVNVVVLGEKEKVLLLKEVYFLQKLL